MLKIAYFFLLLTFSTAVVVINSTTSIDIQVTNTMAIMNSSSEDSCLKLATGSSKLFHLNTDVNFQMWDLTNLGLAPVNSSWINFFYAGMDDLFL